MNDEIKEILKILKKCEFGACITKHNSRVLLDYITNLQQENERLKENNSDMQEEMARVWEENERLKEDYAKIVSNNCDYLKLEQENERLKEREKELSYHLCLYSSEETMLKQINDYKSRLEKAIEYIKENNCPDPYCLTDDLLNILQNGSDSQ